MSVKLNIHIFIEMTHQRLDYILIVLFLIELNMAMIMLQMNLQSFFILLQQKHVFNVLVIFFGFPVLAVFLLISPIFGGPALNGRYCIDLIHMLGLRLNVNLRIIV